MLDFWLVFSQFKARHKNLAAIAACVPLWGGKQERMYTIDLIRRLLSCQYAAALLGQLGLILLVVVIAACSGMVPSFLLHVLCEMYGDMQDCNNKICLCMK